MCHVHVWRGGGGGGEGVEMTSGVRSVCTCMARLHTLRRFHFHLGTFLPRTQMSHFIKRELLTDQVKRMKIISGYVTNLQRVGPGHGEYHFDHETLGE